MKRSMTLILAALLLVPAPVAAYPPPGKPLAVGDSVVVYDGDQDATLVTVLEVRTPRSLGVMRPPSGKRLYLIHLRYEWVKGQPYVLYSDWRAQRANGRWLRQQRVRGLKRLPITVLYEEMREHVHGWVAWYGPADASKVTIIMTRDRYQRFVIGL